MNRSRKAGFEQLKRRRRKLEEVLKNLGPVTPLLQKRLIRRAINVIEEIARTQDEKELTPRHWAKSAERTADLSQALRKALLNLVDAEKNYGWFIRPSPLISSEAVRIADYALRESGLEEACRGQMLIQAPLIQKLLALEDYCHALPALLPDDQGRGKSFERRTRGVPTLRIVSEAAFLFYEVSPEDLTGTVEGPFYKFAANFYELVVPESRGENLPSATDKGVRLTQYVWHVAPLVRQLLQTQDLILATLANPGLLTFQEAKFQELLHKRDRLRKELMNGPDSGR